MIYLLSKDPESYLNIDGIDTWLQTKDSLKDREAVQLFMLKAHDIIKWYIGLQMHWKIKSVHKLISKTSMFFQLNKNYDEILMYQIKLCSPQSECESYTCSLCKPILTLKVWKVNVCMVQINCDS